MKFNWTVKNILRKLLKLIGWLVFSILILLLLIIVAIRIPAVQTKIVHEAISFLEHKIGTKVSLDAIVISFPKKIVLKEFYAEDQARDTLLYASELSIDTDLWGLLHNKIQLNNITIDKLTATVIRKEQDSAFNYSYILKAFAGDTTKIADTTKTAWQFSIYDIDLTSSHLHYDDKLAGNFADLYIGGLQINTNEFDLEKSLIHVDDISLSHVSGSVVQSKNPLPTTTQPSTDTSTFAYDLGINKISLKDIRATYNQQALGQVARINLAEAVLKANAVDLKNQIIDLDEFSLKDTFISYQQMISRQTSAGKLKDTVAYPPPSKAWTVSLNKLVFERNNIQYYNFNEPIKQQAVDFNHLWISQFTAEAGNIKFSDDQIQGELDNLFFNERSGLRISSFKTKFKIDNNSASVDNFSFRSGNSIINLNAHATFASLKTLGDTYPKAKINVRIKSTSIGLQDVLYFQPHLLDSLPLKAHALTKINIDAVVKGAVNNLNVQQLIISMLSKTSLSMHGTIEGLPDINTSAVKLSLDKFYTTRNDLHNILADSLIPKSIQLPEWVSIKGSFKGTLKTPDVETIITSSIGSIFLNGKMILDKFDKENYTANIKTTAFDIGNLLKNKSIGKLDMTASVKGSGLTMKEMDAALNISIDNFLYEGYHYHDFKLNGTLKQYFFSGDANLDDKNLEFTLKGNLDYHNNIPSYKLNFNLINADFKELHLSQRPLRARGTLDVDLATADFKVINGSLDIRNVAIYNGKKLYTVDSLLFASIDQKGQTEIKIDSDILSGRFAGTINLFAMPETLQQFFNNYFSLQNSAYKKRAEPQNFKFNLELKKSELITDILIPELTAFEPGPIMGEFNSAKDDLYIRIAMGKIQYNNIAVDSFLINVNSTKRSLNYNFIFENVRFDSLRIYGMELDGSVMNDSIKTNFFVSDSLAQKKYDLGGVMYSLEDEFRFHFTQNHFMLNYNTWKVNVDNSIRFGKAGFFTNNLWFKHEGEEILFETKTDVDKTFIIEFKDLDLDNLANIISADKKIVDGKLNGDLNILLARNNAFKAEIKINDLKVLEQAWGNISLTAQRETINKFDLDLSIVGENTDIKAEGVYLTSATGSTYNVKLDIAKLNLAIVEPISRKQLKNLTGDLKGKFNLTGDAQKPVINGNLDFTNTHFISTYVNSGFSLKNESIKFNPSGMTFNNFKILDDNNNTAILNGSVNTEAYKDFDFNLALNTKNFQLLNTSANDNDLFYGKVKINTRAKITGTSNEPVVDMTIGLSDDTDFTYVIPQAEKGVLDQKGIVEFIDKDAKKDPFITSLHLKDTIQNTFKGVNLTANIELKDKEIFNVIIDPLTGDKLSVQGNSTLTFRMDPNGEMELSGRYEISKGTYGLSFYKLVKRNFEIVKGGSITWTGDPLNASLDIQALYRVETSPYELVSNQLTSPDQTELNQYKQRIPFLVYLNIKGELLSPQISFLLDMPQDKRNAFGGNVYAKIQDINTRESDLNKQVFSLLLLKRFMADNPFESQTTSLSTTARNSVSKILTEQLNRLSENVKGVQLSFDVKSYDDYSTGTATGQTSLQLGVSKNLLNDRLVVKLSGNVNVEGQNSTQSSFTDYIGDLALEYKMTPDGRFRITGFRNSDYDMIDGGLIKTGAGLIYIKDYDTFRELFRKNEKEQ